MAHVIKTTDGKIEVSYPTREVLHTVTLAEYDLIRSIPGNKVPAIKFIRSQYGLGLYEAKQVVDTILGQPEAQSSNW